MFTPRKIHFLLEQCKMLKTTIKKSHHNLQHTPKRNYLPFTEI